MQKALLRTVSDLGWISWIFLLGGCATEVFEEPPSNTMGGPTSGVTEPSQPGPLQSEPAAPSPTDAPTSGPSAAMTSPAIVTTAPTSVPTPTASPTALPTEPPVATVPAGPAGEVLLFEDFQDGVANGWIADADDGNDLVGMWQVVSDGTNSTYQELTEYSDDSWAVGGDVTWTDQAVEAVVSFTSAASLVDATVSLAVRFQSRESYYFVQYRGDGTIKIRKRFEGSTPELSSVDNVQLVADLGQTFTLKFQAQGTTLSVFANNFMVSSVVDTDLASGGVALAVVDGTAAFDNVTVTLP